MSTSERVEAIKGLVGAAETAHKMNDDQTRDVLLKRARQLGQVIPCAD